MLKVVLGLGIFICFSVYISAYILGAKLMLTNLAFL